MSLLAMPTAFLTDAPRHPQASGGRRSIDRLLAPARQLARARVPLLENTLGPFEVGGERYFLPRFVFSGPASGDDPLRIGIFAAIHGDEPEGALALIQLLGEFFKKPALAEGYRIYAYPLGNPTGYEDNTRASRRGRDLNREFWNDSEEPEILLLEQELWIHSFHGIISLHGDDTSAGVYGFVRGPDLSEELLKPALRAAEKILPRDPNPVIDGFDARDGIIHRGYEGILAAPPELRPRPFEIVFETARHAPLHLQVEALLQAIKAILNEYRQLVAFAPNL